MGEKVPRRVYNRGVVDWRRRVSGRTQIVGQWGCTKSSREMCDFRLDMVPTLREERRTTLRMSRKANAGAASAGKKMYCFLEQKMLEFAYFGDLDAIDGRRSARSNYTFKSRCKAVLYLLPTGALLNSVLCLITGARSRLCLPVGRHDRAHPLQARMHVAKRLLQRSCILCSIPT